MKNPFLSMWLSAANTQLGAARGLAAAQAKRQSNAWMNDAMGEAVKFWSGAWLAPQAPQAKRRKRR